MSINTRVFNSKTRESGLVVRSGLMITVKWVDSGSFSSFRNLPDHIKVCR